MIKNPNEIVQELVSDYQCVFGSNLKSVIMYGSAVSHEFRPGASPIVVALVLEDTSITALARCSGACRKWERRGVATPLFLTPDYIASSLDAYPVEFLDMQTSYRVLFGEDYIKPLDIEKRHLRLQCEREFKGIALHLRSSFVEASGNEKRMRGLLDVSMKKMLPLFKALLALGGRKIPAISSEVFSSAEDMLGLDAGIFSRVTGAARARGTPPIDLLDRFTAAVDEIIRHVNAMEGDGNR